MSATGAAPGGTERDAHVRPAPYAVWIGQVVALQGALVLGLLGVPRGLSGLPLVAAALAGALLAVARVRGRWLFQWLPALVAAAGHRHPVAGIGTVSTVDIDGVVAGMVVDPTGRVVAVCVGGDAVAPGHRAPVPDPAALLDAAPDASAVQLVLSVDPAPRSGPLAGNYHQLTRGAVPAATRAVLAVRATGSVAALVGAVRQILALLAAAGVDARPLPPDELRRVLLGTAAAPGVTAAAGAPARPAKREIGSVRWRTVAAGDGYHCGVLVRDCPVPAGTMVTALLPVAARLGARCTIALLSTRPPRSAPRPAAIRLPRPAAVRPAPAAAVRPGAEGVRLSAEVVRLSGDRPEAPVMATRRLVRHLATLGVRAYPANGEQALALAATLPLARTWPAATHGTRRSRVGIPLAAGGLFLGTDRDGAPVTLRLFRARPTIVYAVGPREISQMVVLRAAGLGATVQVVTDRPGSWRRVAAAGGGVIRPPADAAGSAGSAAGVDPAEPGGPGGPAQAGLRPPSGLTVLDVDAATREGSGDLPPVPPYGCLLVRLPRLTDRNAAQLRRADLVLLASLSPAEAELAADSLGYGVLRDWLDRVPPRMVALTGGGALRWARVVTNAAERALVDSEPVAALAGERWPAGG